MNRPGLKVARFLGIALPAQRQNALAVGRAAALLVGLFYWLRRRR